MCDQPEALSSQLAVLVVEDDADTRVLYTTYLGMEGFQVLEAPSIREALAHLSRSTPHVVLTDVMLPDGDGHDLCSAVREACPHTPVIALTGRELNEHDRPAREVGGFDAILQKPCELDDLIAAIRSVVRT